ncbi:hypothetical protein DQ400_18115 [Vreelandella sulfidaeris]|uniref:Uncharacterized protein n=1 Tax=Vreelandella sulfidaeris TaxID=115553 RepID=A0A365TII5_9GAMM|nr:hypothetical protein [Halomonas sulfidaeris]RBI65398.1 hypothetical protein DQ400_18115 [Halomonas sulfidaeris]
MSNDLAVFEEYWVTEDWELARQVILGSDKMYELYGAKIEADFEVELGNLESIIELPDAKLKKLKDLLIANVITFVKGYDRDLKRKVCEEWDYCSKRNSSKAEKVEYLILALDIVATSGLLALVTLLLKREYFDKLCKCSNKSMFNF